MKEINRYRLALLQYRLCLVLPFLKMVFKTEDGFCYHFNNVLRSYENQKLPTLSLMINKSELAKYFPFWFKKGDLKPRIQLLKESIKECKRK